MRSNLSELASMFTSTPSRGPGANKKSASGENIPWDLVKRVRGTALRHLSSTAATLLPVIENRASTDREVASEMN